MPNDYITLQRRIWDELDRDDITAQAVSAINSAIRYYAGRRFWFNEARWTLSASAGQEYYATPANFRDLDTLKVTVNQNDYLLFQRTWETIENWSISPSTYTGYPTDYALHANQFRLYPVPNDAYLLTLAGLRDLEELSADGVISAWTDEAEELIRSRACADLLENILQDYTEPRVEFYRRREREMLATLREETNRRIMTGRVKKAPW